MYISPPPFSGTSELGLARNLINMCVYSNLYSLPLKASNVHKLKLGIHVYLSTNSFLLKILVRFCPVVHNNMIMSR